MKMSTHLDDKTASIARLSLHDPDSFSIQYSQTLHRLEFLQQWRMPLGSKVLELGCGQGDCTTVLADAVGEEGRVVAVGPADLGYESPWTLGEAQSHISQGPLGKRISWIHKSPLDYLASISAVFDATLLAHSLWYFPSPSLILGTFRALKGYSKRLLLAEWALVVTSPSAQPHVLAALAQAALECRKLESVSNVRTVLSPKRLNELALEAGWTLTREAYVQPGERVLDGQWEAKATLGERFGRELEEFVSDEREEGMVYALRDACEANLKGLEGDVRAMDVWVGSFV